MMRKAMSWIILAAAAMAPVSGAAGQQTDPSVTSPNLGNLSAKQPILEYVLAGGFLLGAMAIGFKPTNRVKEKA